MVEVTTEPVSARVGTVVRSLRKWRGLSLKELAKQTGISQIQLSRIERLESAPTEEKIRILAKVLDVPVSVLFGEQPFTHQLDRLETNILQIMVRGAEARQQIQNMRLAQRRDSSSPSDFQVAAKPRTFV